MSTAYVQCVACGVVPKDSCELAHPPISNGAKSAWGRELPVNGREFS